MANGTQYSFQRIEKKYIISPAQMEALLNVMRRHMTADRYGEYAIGNIYCDTDNFRLIRASLEKPAYKEKLRIRCYGVPKAGDKVFVELKKKCGGVVYKRRVTAPLPQAERFLRTETARPNGDRSGRSCNGSSAFTIPCPACISAMTVPLGRAPKTRRCGSHLIGTSAGGAIA